MNLKPALELKRTWLGLLEQIRERPAMFYGNSTLQGFESFLAGFGLAEKVYAIPKEQVQVIEDFPWHDFESSIAQRYNARRLSLNSFGLAQFVSQGQDTHSFEMGKEYSGAWDIWWRWFDEFATLLPLQESQPRLPG